MIRSKTRTRTPNTCAWATILSLTSSGSDWTTATSNCSTNEPFKYTIDAHSFENPGGGSIRFLPNFWGGGGYLGAVKIQGEGPWGFCQISVGRLYRGCEIFLGEGKPFWGNLIALILTRPPQPPLCASMRLQVTSLLKKSISSSKVDGHTNRVFCIANHPQNPHEFVSAGWDNTLQVWLKPATFVLNLPRLS